MKPAIQIENLGKRYRMAQQAGYLSLRESLASIGRSGKKKEWFWALEDLNLQVQPGERLGIVGHNGAGKSTLLKILSRITPPSTGRIGINGRLASLLEVGTGFHPELSGRENIYLNGSILGLKKAEIKQQFDAIVDFSGVESFLNTPLKHYSSGMQLRLAFAVAAHLEPEILLIDEVLAVGDMEFQKKCLGKMEEVSRSQGRTIIFVSHNMGAIKNLCQTAICLQKGRLADQGSAAEVVERYILSHSGSNSLSIDLSKAARFGNLNGKARISHLLLNGGQPVRNGAPLQIQLKVETQGQLNEIVAGIGFCSLDGNRVMTLDTDNTASAAKSFNSLGIGEMNVELILPQCQLQPGMYFIDLALRSPNNALSYDYLQNCATIEVVPGDTTPDIIVNYNYNGGVRPPVLWKIIDNAQ